MLNFVNCQNMVRCDTPVKYDTIKNRVDNEPIELSGDTIKMASQRYKVFDKSNKCVTCGIVGEYYYKCKHNSDVTYHLNLYAQDNNGNAILMTKDHIIPKSKGGKNFLSNYQTMCIICNNEKGSNLI